MSFLHKLLASLSGVLLHVCVIASCQHIKKQKYTYIYINKTKSKYSSQKIHSSIEFGSRQFKSCFMWRDQVFIDGTSGKLYVIG